MFSVLSKNEREFLQEAIKADCRADARMWNETRLLRQSDLAQKDNKATPVVSFGEENGQVLVQVGQTKVLTSSALKIVSPKPGKPNEGELRVQIDFGSLLHAAEFSQQTTTLTEMRVELSNFIDKVIKSSRTTDREGLCIV